MIRIVDIKNEYDYRVLLNIESSICKNEPNTWHRHFGGIGVDRYFFGEGKNDIFEYGKLIYNNKEVIGYSLVYCDEFEYSLGLLSQWKEASIEVMLLIENLFEKGHEITTNCGDRELVNQMKSIGYTEAGESIFNGVVELESFKEAEISWDSEEIRILTSDDIDERVKYSSLSTGEEISKEMYEEYMQSQDSENVIDYVVSDKKTGEMAGYYSWWMDSVSNTVMLNPVACIEQYRKRGISKRAILKGLNQMKNNGFSHAYVDTTKDNIPAIALYESVGFKRCNKIVKMVKFI